MDNERAKRILAALVREYISSGEPVPSSLLVSLAGVGVSSATVRNILARLEDEGFVQQPHTSAGRIPTDRGYRFYVDLLLESRRSSRASQAVEARLRRDSSGALVDAVLSQVSHVMSQASRHVGFAIRPGQQAAVFDRIEFVPLTSTRVLVVLVALGGHVIQKVIDITESLGADELRHASNYLNEEFRGKLRLLRGLCQDIVELRRGDHSGARLNMERERSEREREKTEAEVAAQFERWASNQQVRDALCKNWLHPEERTRRLRELFGLAPEPAVEAAPPTPESNPVKPSQTGFATNLPD